MKTIQQKEKKNFIYQFRIRGKDIQISDVLSYPASLLSPDKIYLIEVREETSTTDALKAREERDREILGEIEKELQKHIACNKIGGKEIEKGYWVIGFHQGLMWIKELLKLKEQ